MRSGRRTLTEYEMRMDVLGENFDTVFSMLMRDRDRSVYTLADQEANVWARKKALARVTEIDKACKALVNIMGAMEDACETSLMNDPDFMPVTESTLS